MRGDESFIRDIDLETLGESSLNSCCVVATWKDGMIMEFGELFREHSENCPASIISVNLCERVLLLLHICKKVGVSREIVME